MRQLAIWLLAGIASVAFTLLVFFPASWVATVVEEQTAGRLTLGDAQGTLWRGSAFVGGAASGHDAVTPLLPGRFSWRLSPMVLLGMVDAGLENPATLSQPVKITGSWQQWQITPAEILLPAERLTALGAPLNTIQPSGQMRLSWGLLQFARQNGRIGITGSMNLVMNDIASRLSPVKPLGTYDLALTWHGQQASILLKTEQGAMLLNGSGLFRNGRLKFSGTAEAAIGQEERLENFLNLLGKRRKANGKDVIALEVK